MSFLSLLDVDVTGFSNPLYLVADMCATVPSSPFCVWVPSVPFPSSPHSLLHSLQGGVKELYGTLLSHGSITILRRFIFIF